MRDSLLNGPPVHPFVECPNCKELVELGATNCSRCREEISADYALMSAVLVHHNTQACSAANTITSFNAFIPLALILGTAIYLIDWYSSGTPRLSLGILLWPLMPLLAIVIWYFRFGRFSLGDDEYLRARREMKSAFLFWLVLLIVQVLLIAVAWKYRN